MTEPIRLLVADGATSRFGLRVRNSPAAAAFRLLHAGQDAPEALLASAPEADAILCYQAEVGARLIEAAPALRLIQKQGLNCKNIDVAAATRRNVRVATLPLMRSITVAEHALAIMLACARKVIPGYRAITGAVYKEMGLAPIVTSQREGRVTGCASAGVARRSRRSARMEGCPTGDSHGDRT